MLALTLFEPSPIVVIFRPAEAGLLNESTLPLLVTQFLVHSIALHLQHRCFRAKLLSYLLCNLLSGITFFDSWFLGSYLAKPGVFLLIGVW